MATKKSTNGKRAAEVGAGLAAAAAAAAAGYYFYGSDKAKQHRAAASKWAKDMKAQVVKETKKVKKIDQKQVAKIVDRAAAAYASARSVNQQDLKAAAAELKKHWRRLSEEVASRAKRPAQKAAKKSSKKAAPKKSSKKAAKRRPRKQRNPRRRAPAKVVD